MDEKRTKIGRPNMRCVKLEQRYPRTDLISSTVYMVVSETAGVFAI